MLKPKGRTKFGRVHYLLVLAVACLHLLTAKQLLRLHLEASTSMHVLYRESNMEAEDATR